MTECCVRSKAKLHTGGRHLGAARAEELRVRQLPAQRGNEFRREQIPARLTGDEHEGFEFQLISKPKDLDFNRTFANHFSAIFPPKSSSWLSSLASSSRFNSFVSHPFAFSDNPIR